MGATAPRPTSVPIAAYEDDLTNSTVLKAFDGLLIAEVVATIQADGDLQALPSGLFIGSQQSADTRGVAGHRLFHEHVFALSDRVFILHGPKVGVGGEDHHIDAAVDGLLVRIETDESTLGRHVDLFAESLVCQPIVRGLLALDKPGQTGLQPVLEHIGHGP